MVAPATNGNKLPEELITDILLRLPVKSLLRFRAVSVRWLSLITSLNFINWHLHRAITNSDHDDNFILREDDDSISLIHLISDQIPRVDLGLPYSKGEFPYVPHSSLIGSYNGIICVALSDYPRLDEFNTDFHKFRNPMIYLWNPATKQSKLIAPLDTIDDDKISVCHGFGFDSVTTDFKVVRIFATVEEPTNKRAEVYSANNNVWRVIEPHLVHIPCGYVINVCVKGFICCLGKDGLITFDLNKEVFSCDIKLPTIIHHFACITEFKGSVAVIGYSDYDESDYSNTGELNSKITLWRLDDACLCGGIEESWTMIFNVDVSFPVEFVRCYFNSGDILIYTGGNYEGWSLYNPDKKELKHVQVPLLSGRIFKYIESLVSIRGFKQVKS